MTGIVYFGGFISVNQISVESNPFYLLCDLRVVIITWIATGYGKDTELRTSIGNFVRKAIYSYDISLTSNFSRSIRYVTWPSVFQLGCYFLREITFTWRQGCRVKKLSSAAWGIPAIVSFMWIWKRPWKVIPDTVIPLFKQRCVWTGLDQDSHSLETAILWSGCYLFIYTGVDLTLKVYYHPYLLLFL